MKKTQETQRIKVKMYTTLYNDIKKTAFNIGLSPARFISMMITDTILRNVEITVNNSSKLSDKRKSTTYVNITVSQEIYDQIVDTINGLPKYHIRDYVVDCILYQMDFFSKIKNASLNNTYKQSKRISKSMYRGAKRYSEEEREKYQMLSPLDKYFDDMKYFASTNSHTIKQYFLAKQMQHILDAYVGDFANLIYCDEEEFL